MCSNSQGYYGSNNLLSPAAQAVRRAAASAYWAEEYEVASPDVIAAAALRAAVEKCAGLPDGRDCTELLRSIATELESHQ